MNTHSGNLLPMTADDSGISFTRWTYGALIWSIETIYIYFCIAGTFYVSKERALQDSTVNIVVTMEVYILSIYLHSRSGTIKQLIEKFDYLLNRKDEMLESVRTETTKPMKKPLTIYTIGAVAAVMTWSAIPITKIFWKDRFTYEDYRVPANIGKEPFSTGVFLCGIFIEIIGSGYAISKKIGLDLYVIHMILLLTTQYKYLNIKLAAILRDGSDEDFCELPRVKYKTNRFVDDEVRELIRHYEVVVQINTLLKSLLSFNVGILYVENVFRFCFLGVMIVSDPFIVHEKLLVVLYTVGTLMQVFILCFCVHQLFEASTTLTHDAFHEKWYTQNPSLRHSFATMTMANKLDCKLTACRSIDLTLPSFMKILNHAYSICLLFLKVK